MDPQRELIELLLQNGRYTTEELTQQTELNENEVTETLQTLEEAEVIRGYQAIIDWNQLDAEHVEAIIELNVELDRETSYREIAQRIAKFPEVFDLRLVSGEYDFALKVHGPSMHTVSDFVADRIAPIPEITQTVTHFVMTTYKDRGIQLEGDDEDDRLAVSP